MPTTTDLGQAGLASWRAAIADRVAPTASKKTPLSEDQIRAAIGAAFFALATFYVVSSAVRMIKTARGG
jgi:hypothetical protein